MIAEEYPVTAVAGLSLAAAPDFAHYFPFFASISDQNRLGAGAATGLAAAAGATLFISIALMIVHCKFDRLLFLPRKR